MPLAAETLRRVLTLVPERELVWTAKNGREAIEFCAKRAPDLVLMDLIMPEMGGVEATRQIMANTPCAIVIVTSDVKSHSSRVFEAMGHGALDAVNTPALDFGDLSAAAAPLLAKIATVERLIRGTGPAHGVVRSRRVSAASRQELVTIGASAGGPAALAVVLGGLPSTFAAPIVVIQHVDERFVSGMADWLGQKCVLPVRLAVEGDHPQPGTVLLAGTGDHLAFKAANRLGYTPVPRDYVYRPSVDVFFQSVSKLWPGRAVGVLLTGMGRDGAVGLKALRAKGHYTIAQDKASSAVYGMPKAAAEVGAAVDVLPLKRIAPKLIEYFCPQGLS
ncbi:MAG: chemotaxis response regulator protein-glutamate methylesterase [Pseudomonadota bacterium]